MYNNNNEIKVFVRNVNIFNLRVDLILHKEKQDQGLNYKITHYKEISRKNKKNK